MKGISLLEKRRTGNLDSRIHLTKRILVVYEISGSHIITPPLSSYLKTPVFAVISLKKVAEDIREPGVNRCNFADVRKLERETRRRVWWLFEGRGVENLSLSIRWLLVVREKLFVRKIVLCCLNLQEYSKIFELGTTYILF